VGACSELQGCFLAIDVPEEDLAVVAAADEVSGILRVPVKEVLLSMAYDVPDDLDLVHVVERNLRVHARVNQVLVQVLVPLDLEGCKIQTGLLAPQVFELLDLDG